MRHITKLIKNKTDVEEAAFTGHLVMPPLGRFIGC